MTTEISENLASIYEIFVSIGNPIKTILIGIAGAIAVIMVVVAGIKFITGGQTGATEASSHLKNIVIGIALIALAGAIVTFTISAISGYSPSAGSLKSGSGIGSGYTISDFEA